MTGGYPNEAVFWGSDLAMSTREKRLDINPIVRKARMAEHCDIVPFRMIGDTRIEVPIRKFTTEKHAVRAYWLEPAWSSAGKPGRKFHSGPGPSRCRPHWQQGRGQARIAVGLGQDEPLNLNLPPIRWGLATSAPSSVGVGQTQARSSSHPWPWSR